jgi:hypothetical protein
MSDFWTRLKTHLNESLRNNEKRRIIIINELKRNHPVPVDNMRYSNTVSGYSITTFDSYLNYLFQAGYLYKPRYGTYGLSREIPVDLSLDDVRNEAYAYKQENIGEREILRKHGIMLHEKKTEYFSEEEFTI